MSLEQGVNKLLANQGVASSAGQKAAGKYASFTGILGSDEFDDLRNRMKGYMGTRNIPGRGALATSLQRKVAGDKSRKGMTQEAKNAISKTMSANEAIIADMTSQLGLVTSDLSTANTTIADQQTQIDALQSQLEELKAIPEEEVPTEVISLDEEGIFGTPV